VAAVAPWLATAYTSEGEITANSGAMLL